MCEPSRLLNTLDSFLPSLLGALVDERVRQLLRDARSTLASFSMSCSNSPEVESPMGSECAQLQSECTTSPGEDGSGVVAEIMV